MFNLDRSLKQFKGFLVKIKNPIRKWIRIGFKH